MDSRRLPEAALNERRRHAVKLREASVSVREVARQCELSTHTVVAAHKSFRRGGWSAVRVKRGGRPVGSGRQLTPEQEKKIQQLTQRRTANQLKLARPQCVVHLQLVRNMVAPPRTILAARRRRSFSAASDNFLSSQKRMPR